jgi:thymidylate kinase
MTMTTRIQGAEAIPATRTYPPGTIPALAALLDDLEEARIRYCSWKSNQHLAEGLAGLTDLDLLVDRRDAAGFRAIVARQGLKPVLPPLHGAFPAMEHLLGFDATTGRLFHLHVHYQLVLGERYVKNYRLPIEDGFLDGTGRLHGVPVSRPELELSLLAPRTLLKYRARDVVKDVLGIRSPGIPEQTIAEFRWLLERTTVEEVRAALRAIGDPVPPEIVCGLMEIVTRAPRSGYALLRLRTHLRHRMKAYRRRGRVRASAKYLGTVWRRRERFRRRPIETGMRPVGGGLTLAVVGADGSGKSTVTAALAEWLSWKLEVRSLYMGSKEPSRASRSLYLAFRALRRGHRTVAGRLGPGSVVTRPIAWTRDVALALHHLSIGRDRVRRRRRGEREARAGHVVIFDRFPLESLGSDREHRLLDGPQVGSALNGSRSGVVRWLSRAEVRMYRGFGLPDQLIVLDVRPEVAVRRKPDHVPDLLAAKARAAVHLAALAETSSGPARASRIDANRPLDAVLLEVKATVWDVL